MSSTKKLLVTFGILLFMFGSTIFVTSRRIFLNGFLKLEKEAAIMDVSKTVNSIGYITEQIDLTTNDWAQWTDTYKYAQTHDKNYETANFYNSAFTAIKINAIIVLDKKGGFIYR